MPAADTLSNEQQVGWKVPLSCQIAKAVCIICTFWNVPECVFNAQVRFVFVDCISGMWAGDLHAAGAKVMRRRSGPGLHC